MNILVAEKDGIIRSQNKISVAHPDNGELWEKILPNDGGSYWYTNTAYVRLPVDLTYTRTDASSFILRGVLDQDDRMVRVPHKYGESINQRYQQLPPADF